MADKAVLVVDDEMDIRETIQEALELYGISVVTASNGLEALSVLSLKKNINLILLDMMMPVMDGREFMEMRRHSKDLKEIPVVIVTANRESDLNGFQLSAQGFLKKPIELNDLINVVRQNQSQAT